MLLFAGSAYSQSVVPRYGDGKDFPAGKLIGGAYNGSLAVTVGAVSVSEDYDKPIAHWQGGMTDSTTHKRADIGEAFLSAEVIGVTIDGHGGLQGNPSRHKDADCTYDGIILKSNGYKVERLRAFDVPGTAGKFSRVSNP